MSRWVVDSRNARFVAFALLALLFLGAIKLGLLVPIYAGLLVFVLVTRLSDKLLHIHSNSRGTQARVAALPWWSLSRPPSTAARLVAVTAVASVVITALIGLGLGLHLLLRNGADVHDLLLEISDIVSSARNWIPQSLSAMLPDNFDLLTAAGKWLRTHAAEIGTVGLGALRIIGYMLLGILLGAMISVAETALRKTYGPASQLLGDQLAALCDAFWRVVSAQFWISAVNTVATSIYLLVILPAFGVHLPFAKTLVAVTFVMGLLPVVGNLISNTAITIISLAQSLQVAVFSLAYLVIIHKLEYFLNARIVGIRINARAYEILLAMLIMEHMFGAAGVVAAPVFYAWLKAEWHSWDRIGVNVANVSGANPEKAANPEKDEPARLDKAKQQRS